MPTLHGRLKAAGASLIYLSEFQKSDLGQNLLGYCAGSKKKARMARAESIFFEEDRGDGSDYASTADMNPIAVSDVSHFEYE